MWMMMRLPRSHLRVGAVDMQYHPPQLPALMRRRMMKMLNETMMNGTMMRRKRTLLVRQMCLHRTLHRCHH